MTVALSTKNAESGANRPAPREETMGNVSQIIAAKGSSVHSVPPGAIVYDSIETMVGRNVGSVLVQEGDRIVGIFTERDYLRRVLLEDRDPKKTRVAEVMTPRIIAVDPQRSIEECMAIMTQQRIRHLPVMDGNRLAGIISIGDVVKHLSKEREVEIRYLTEYITGRAPD
jgi:CBS domain-containing protein